MPVLLALQTTTDGLDESTLDAVTLVLLTGFVLSMFALAILLFRRESAQRRESPEARTPESPIAPQHVERPPAVSRPPTSRPPVTPVWLTGVSTPRQDVTLAEVATSIERLLRARRDGNLVDGLAVCSPRYRARLADELGIPEAELADVLRTAEIQGDTPTLRSIELTGGSGQIVKARAGYTDRSTEVYELTMVDGVWAIDSIERG
ncbi:MAG: hypothetical protein R2855_05100 [Thermomicrobiales bacterium]